MTMDYGNLAWLIRMARFMMDQAEHCSSRSQAELFRLAADHYAHQAQAMLASGMVPLPEYETV
jgi:hypothetical protein